MYNAAQKATGVNDIKIYGHTPTLRQHAGGTGKEKAVSPVPSTRTDLVLVLDEHDEASWMADTLGDYLATSTSMAEKEPKGGVNATIEVGVSWARQGDVWSSSSKHFYRSQSPANAWVNA